MIVGYWATIQTIHICKKTTSTDVMLTTRLSKKIWLSLIFARRPILSSSSVFRPLTVKFFYFFLVSVEKVQLTSFSLASGDEPKNIAHNVRASLALEEGTCCHPSARRVFLQDGLGGVARSLDIFWPTSFLNVCPLVFDENTIGSSYINQFRRHFEVFSSLLFIDTDQRSRFGWKRSQGLCV